MQSIDEPVLLADYDEAWPSAFSEERNRLAAALRVPQDRLEHIGSTAVPGLLAKPVIDIMLGVERWPPDTTLIHAISRAGYEFLGEAGVPERLYFRLRGPTSFNLHVVRLDGTHWRANLALRDYLRRSESARSRYARAKLAAVSAGNTTLLAYSAAKSAVIADLLSAALARDVPDAGEPARDA